MLHVEYEGTKEAPFQFGLEQLYKSYNSLQKPPGLTVMLTKSKTVEEQGYRLRREENRIFLSCGGESGVLYALLDLSDFLRREEGELETLTDREVKPYLKKRGIKCNIPLDARTPSYSDASDSAFWNIGSMWEAEFWEEFLDEMALQKYNVLSLWSLSPFPSLVKVPEYPLASLTDVKSSLVNPRPEMSGFGMYGEDMEEGLFTVKKMTVEEKINHWQRVMAYAADRCIQVYLFTWNLFVYGTEHTPYGITCDQANPITADYLYHAVRACMKTYPLLAGIGITAGENMKGDKTNIPFLRNTYGRAVEDQLKEEPDRDFVLIHRMQYARWQEIMDCYRDFKGRFEISFKYSQAHMYSSAKPVFFDRFLEDKGAAADKVRFWMTLRDDDFYRWRFGDPSYVREYLKNLPAERMSGFYMGADGYTWGREYAAVREKEHPLYIRRMWYKFMMWGQLSYNEKLEETYFIKELKTRFQGAGEELYRLWKQVSQIIPLVNKVHWHDYDFQWYPEGSCMFLHPPVGKLVFANVREFSGCGSMPGSGWISVKEYCEKVRKKEKPDAKNPVSAAARLLRIYENAADGIDGLRKTAVSEPAFPYNGSISCREELDRILDDLETQVLLGRYYAHKLYAAAAYTFSGMADMEKEKRKEYQVLCVHYLKLSGRDWARYSQKAAELFKAVRLTRLGGLVDFRSFDREAGLEYKLAQEE